MQQKYTVIFWDWNGTLLNDIDECISIINKSLKKRSLRELNKNLYLEKFEFPVKNYYQNIGFDFSAESFEEVGMEYIRAYDDVMLKCELHQGAVKALDFFSNQGVRQYVLSALNHSALQKCVNSYGLADFFETVNGLGDSYAHSKVELGVKLVQEVKKPSDKVLMIGDTVHDYETAREMGVDCMLVASGHNSRQRLEKCQVPVFDSLSEIIANFNCK